MTKLLVIFEGNWADEMDIKGFDIVTKEWWDEFVESIPENKHLSQYIGSNQGMYWDGKKDYLRDFKIAEITKDEEAVIKKFFPHQFGKVPYIEPDSD